MNIIFSRFCAHAMFCMAVLVNINSAHADHALRVVLPDAMVDLRTTDGAARVKGQWRYSDTHIHEIEHRSVGADLKASGPKNKIFDFSPMRAPPILMIQCGKKFLLIRWKIVAAMEGFHSIGIASMSRFPKSSAVSIQLARRSSLKLWWMITRKFG